LLEKLYLEALKRKSEHRVLTIHIHIDGVEKFYIFSEVLRWISSQ
jgi:hypothetical protein